MIDRLRQYTITQASEIEWCLHRMTANWAKRDKWNSFFLLLPQNGIFKGNQYIQFQVSKQIETSVANLLCAIRMLVPLKWMSVPLKCIKFSNVGTKNALKTIVTVWVNIFTYCLWIFYREYEPIETDRNEWAICDTDYVRLIENCQETDGEAGIYVMCNTDRLSLLRCRLYSVHVPTSTEAVVLILICASQVRKYQKIHKIIIHI